MTTLTSPWAALTIAAVTLGTGTGAIANTGSSSFLDIRNSVGTYGPISRPTRPSCFSYRRKPKANISSCTRAADQPAEQTLADYRNRIIEAVVFLHHNKPKLARQRLSGLLTDYPDSVRLMVLAARVALYESAVFGTHDQRPRMRKLISRARSMAPDDVIVIATQGYVQFMDTELFKARETFDQLLAMRPKHIFSLVHRAQVHQYFGRMDLTVKDLNKAIAIDPDNLWPRGLRANINLALGKTELAIEDFDVLVRLGNGDAESLGGRAYALQLLGRRRDALRDLNAILNTDPKKPRYALGAVNRATVLLKRAMLHRELGDDQSAAADIILSLRLGDRSNVLRTQLFLRSHGLEDIKINGEFSDGLMQAVRKCFTTAVCTHGLYRKL